MIYFTLMTMEMAQEVTQLNLSKLGARGTVENSSSLIE